MNLVQVSDQELMEVDGGVVLSAAFIGATVVWSINAGLFWYGVRQVTDK